MADTADGLTWTAPAGWTKQADRPMRAATYSIPSAGGAEPGECAVFYFGPGQGGGIQANIDRWYGQFQSAQQPPAPRKAAVQGMTVTYVEHSGTYMASSGPMMSNRTAKPGFSLLGAIVEGPEGSVFFKLTGPAATVKSVSAAFEKMIQGIKK